MTTSLEVRLYMGTLDETRASCLSPKSFEDEMSKLREICQTQINHRDHDSVSFV